RATVPLPGDLERRLEQLFSDATSAQLGEHVQLLEPEDPAASLERPLEGEIGEAHRPVVHPGDEDERPAVVLERAADGIDQELRGEGDGVLFELGREQRHDGRGVLEAGGNRGVGGHGWAGPENARRAAAPRRLGGARAVPGRPGRRRRRPGAGGQELSGGPLHVAWSASRGHSAHAARPRQTVSATLSTSGGRKKNRSTRISWARLAARKTSTNGR